VYFVFKPDIFFVYNEKDFVLLVTACPHNMFC